MNGRAKIHSDVAETEDVFFAAYIHYLGHPIYKCAAGPSRTVWTFLVPECDFNIMREEFESDQPILVKSYASALKRVFNFQKLARRSAGEHITDEWRELFRRRNDVA